MDGTPIFDIKPYIPYADAHPDARSGFAPDAGQTLDVRIPDELFLKIPENKCEALRGVLANDPRPRYQRDPDRVYVLDFADFTVRFTVSDGVLTVVDIGPQGGKTNDQNEKR